MSENRQSGQPADEPGETSLAGGRVKVLQRQTLWSGFVRLSQMTVRVPGFNGGEIEQVREIHDHGAAAALLPVDAQRRTILLVRQWRIPPLLMGDSEPLLEVVAGLIDDGETPEQCAMREALEETGHAVNNLQPIMQGYASPGTLTEYFHLFAGDYHKSSKQGEGGGLAHEDEDIQLVEMGFDEARRMMQNGEIRDAKTFIALTWLLARHE